MKKFIVISIVVVVVVVVQVQLGLGMFEIFVDLNINGDVLLLFIMFGSGCIWNVCLMGVVGGISGICFMVVQGVNLGIFVSWGLVEFDLVEVQVELQQIVDNMLGVIGYEIIDVSFFIVQQQVIQLFMVCLGMLEFYYVDNDVFFVGLLLGNNYFMNLQLGVVNMIDSSYNYVMIFSVNFNFNEVGLDYSIVIVDWNSGIDVICIIVNFGDFSVVVLFKGLLSLFQGINVLLMMFLYNIIFELILLVLLSLVGFLICCC